MYAFQVILIAFQAISLASASNYGLPGESNGTVSYVLVNPDDLTPDEVARFEKVERRRQEKYGKHSKRDCNPHYYHATALVGNGNPHQNQHFQQVTGNIGCNGAGNSVSYDTSVSVGWSVSVGVAYSWISGGFSVEESWTQGSTYSVACQPWDTEICIYEAIIVTAYTVINQACSSGCGLPTHCESNGGNFVMYSPNSNQFGGCFLKGANNRINCGNEVGSCPGQKNGFIKPCGPAGGPGGTIYCPNYTGQTSQCGVACKPP